MDARAIDAELGRLRDRVAQLEAAARVAPMATAPPRRRRVPRRALPLALVALLLLLTPLGILAASPFNDLTGGPHDANIGAIYDAGITKGCVPNVGYCPTAGVTREEMASFLARTAGLGGNPPVANAKTAQTAQTAQTATNADTATNAGNANTVGGYGASALGRIAFSSTRLVTTAPSFGSADIVQVTLTVPGPAPQAVAVRGAVGLSGQPSGGGALLYLRQDTNPESNPAYFPYETTGGSIGVTLDTEWVFVAHPGAHTYTLRTYTTANGPLTVTNPTLSATTHPFGPTGTAGATASEGTTAPAAKP